jgi:glycolate oxidase
VNRLIKQGVIQDLIKVVGKENLIRNKVALASYSFDSSPYKGHPGVVVFPTSTEMVVQIMKIANKYNVPVLPRGAGTSLSGGTIAPPDSIVVSLTKMNKILEVNSQGRYAVVEGGTTNKAIQVAAQPYGLMFAPDPGSQNVATIGGNIAANAGGMRGVKYGSTKDNILGLEVVLPSGEVVTTGGLHSNIEGNIDLTYLFCGSEGTFGIVTKAWVSLTPIYSEIMTMTATFPSLEDAGSCVAEIIAQGVIPTAMEIMDNIVIVALEEYMKMGLDKTAEALLLIEIDGFPSEVQTQGEKIIKALKNNKANNYQIAKSAAERQELWRGRRSVNGALGKIRPGILVHDIVVPRDRLAFMLKRVAEIAKKYNVIIGQVAHAGDGNTHPSLLYDHRNPEELVRVEKAGEEIIKEALAQGGVITGEHGIGIEKIKYMTLAFTPASLLYMAKVKEAFDPDNLSNPGKKLPPELQEQGGDKLGKQEFRAN